MSSCLPPHLATERHWDWPWPFSLIPRSWTAFCWGAPVLLFGNQKASKKVFRTCGHVHWILYEDEAPMPIGEPESWQISYYPCAPLWALPFAWYVAVSFKRASDGKFAHFRAGARWDDVDNYVQCPTCARRRYTGDPLEDTSTR